MQSANNLFPDDLSSQYLQLPELDSRIRPLTEQIVGNAKTPYDRANAIEAYLRTHYGYTLQLGNTKVPDPIADFLFVRRRGHCEYFSSAMAIMLRTVGIPSRVVNGFAGGEFEPAIFIMPMEPAFRAEIDELGAEECAGKRRNVNDHKPLVAARDSRP